MKEHFERIAASAKRLNEMATAARDVIARVEKLLVDSGAGVDIAEGVLRYGRYREDGRWHIMIDTGEYGWIPLVNAERVTRISAVPYLESLVAAVDKKLQENLASLGVGSP